MSDLNVMLSTLHLVYPPVSSYEADWLREDPQVEALIRSSDFYMIAMRPEVLFDDQNVAPDEDEAQLTLRLTSQTAEGEALEDEVVLDIEQLAKNTIGALPETYVLDGGKKHIRFFPGSEAQVAANDPEPFEWFLTEKLIRDYGRGLPGITGFKKHRDFAVYELLYVGIAKETDTFERLFTGAHEKRQKILSQEYPRRLASRVTDELILFAFRVEPTTFRTIEETDEITPIDQDQWAAYKKRVVRDAEKAFVHLLDPSYNEVKFSNYPRSVDGLYEHGHDRYGYVIAENLTFLAPRATFRGAWDPEWQMPDNSADMITIEGDAVEILRGANSSH